MKNKVLGDEKGFSLIEFYPFLILLQFLVLLITTVFLMVFDVSAYFQWIKFSNVQEASIKLNMIANNIDACIISGRDCASCKQRMLDKQNDLYLTDSYQSPNFRFDIDAHIPGSSSCVINAIKVDAQRNPVYNSKPFPQVSFDCAGHRIDLGDHLSGFELCRDQVGNRTIYGYGSFQSL